MVDIFVFGRRESEKEGPIVGCIRTETNFVFLELLSLFPLKLWACSEELCPLLLLPLGVLDEDMLGYGHSL